MTDIDRQADIGFDPADDHVTVRVPLAGPVTGEWLDCYQKLARAANVPAQVQAGRDRSWVVVRVPAGRDRAGVAATLDAACALVAEADATMRPPATAKPEAMVRDWWAAGGAALPAAPVPGRGAGVRAEKRWPMACTLVLAMAVPLLLPARFSLGPRWAVPAVEALLLVAIIAIDRGRIDRRSAAGPGAVPGAGRGAGRRRGRGHRPADRRPGGGRSGDEFGGRICSRPASWSGSTRSLPFPSSIGRWTKAVLNRVSWPRRSSPTWLSPRGSTRAWLRRAGA